MFMRCLDQSRSWKALSGVFAVNLSSAAEALRSSVNAEMVRPIITDTGVSR